MGMASTKAKLKTSTVSFSYFILMFLEAWGRVLWSQRYRLENKAQGIFVSLKRSLRGQLLICLVVGQCSDSYQWSLVYTGHCWRGYVNHRRVFTDDKTGKF